MAGIIANNVDASAVEFGIKFKDRIQRVCQAGCGWVNHNEGGAATSELERPTGVLILERE